MKSKQKTKVDQTTKPVAPDWLNQPIRDYTSKVEDFLQTDPAGYVAGPSALQEKAFADARKLGGWRASANAAMGTAERAGSQDPSYMTPADGIAGESLLDDLPGYLNPATQQLVDAALVNHDADSARDAAALAASAARGKAFGGSRYGLAEGAFQAESGRKRALTEAELRRDAFSGAAQLAEADAVRRQQASMFNTSMQADRNRYNADARERAYQRALQAAGLAAGISESIGANQRADLGLTADLGTLVRDIEQAKLNALPTQLQMGGAMLGAVPYPAVVGQNTQGVTKTTNSPGLGNVAAGLLGTGLAGWASGGLKF